ncbi:RNA-binding domain-containing protein [Coprinellus micaceus]|uniref:RNA-binding domain-containing protein n=1 Tax=Coprinellus micaceus TaxID=71717 RepID=A0A4Y7TK68_COPMI|nr:RNA-binding domain-containing protein [Coprinellus micaceus]
MASIRPGTQKPYARPSRGGVPTGQWQHDRFNGGPTGRKAAPAPLAPAERGSLGVGGRLEVSNLHYEVTPKDLASIFGQIGTLVREPVIRYDGSGRSTGNAFITFETTAEATRAKNQFDGILAKGQPMSIRVVIRPEGPRRVASAPTTLSLLNRIEKKPLLARVARDDADATRTPTEPKAGRIGPTRTPRGQQQPLPKRGRGGRGGTAARSKKPKTAEELDNELDAFMDDADAVQPGEASTTAAEAAATTGDVEMA